MESPSIDELVAQVVAWHNRHGLARRITSEHVRSIGIVVLPFVLRAAPSVGSAAPDGPLDAAFSDDFIAPLTPRQVALFASKHGSRERPGAATWPERIVPVDPGHESHESTLLYLRTASIELGGHRCRVLIASGMRPRMIGPRAWSASRIAGASAAVTSMAAAGVMALVLSHVPDRLQAQAHPRSAVAHEVSKVAIAEAVSTPVASASSPSAPAPAPAPASASASASTGAPIPASMAASEPTPQIGASASASASADRISTEIRPLLTGDTRATALLEGRRLRAIAPAAKAASAAHETPRVYAVMTASTRARAVAERGHQAMNSSATSGQFPGKPRGDLMQVADGWRAVMWPFRTRAEANRARLVLSGRGIRTEVLEF